MPTKRNCERRFNVCHTQRHIKLSIQHKKYIFLLTIPIWLDQLSLKRSTEQTLKEIYFIWRLKRPKRVRLIHLSLPKRKDENGKCSFKLCNWILLFAFGRLTRINILKSVAFKENLCTSIAWKIVLFFGCECCKNSDGIRNWQKERKKIEKKKKQAEFKKINNN